MKRLDYRIAELEILQTDHFYSSYNQPTTTELQLHQEIQQLAHQLQHTQLYLPDVVINHVHATTTTQTAQLNVYPKAYNMSTLSRSTPKRGGSTRLGSPASGHRAVHRWPGASTSPEPESIKSNQSIKNNNLMRKK